MAALLQFVFKRFHLKIYQLPRNFSTIPSSDKTPFINPLQEDHLKKLYCVSQSEIKSTFPHALPKRLHNQTEALGKTCWILREPSWKIIQRLREDHTDNNRILLYGQDGCGKTICMLQSIHHCLKAGWIVLHVPSVFNWTHTRSQIKPSMKYSGFYDLPDEACAWLHNFKAMNTKTLDTLKLSQDYIWTKKEHSKAGEELAKVIDQGILKPNIATDVFYAVLNEVTQLQSHQVMIAIDDFNGCFNPTSLRQDNQWIKPHELNLVRYLLEFMEPQKFTGPVVLALSKRLMRYRHIRSKNYQLLLGKEGTVLAENFLKVEVSPFSRDEMELYMNYCQSENWFCKELNETTMSELWHLTGGVPRELNRVCSFL